MPRVGAHVARAANALLAATLAPACVACGSILDAPADGPACPACWTRLRHLPPPLCRGCGHPLPTTSASTSNAHEPEARACTVCAAWPDGRITTMRALGPYDGVLEALVHALKYDRRRTLADRLGARLRVAAADVLAGADAAVPVPLHRVREWQRGFNQAELLARALGLPVWRLLRRARATPSQAGLSAAARRRNLADAFARRLLVGRGWAAGRTLVLVDDVCTTGETLLACAAVLREGGAAEVRAAVIARTVLEHGALGAPPSLTRARAAR